VSDDDGSGTTDPRAFAGERMAQYADLWRSATGKLTRGDYHAEDLVDDWFRWVGMVARDTTAAVSLLMGGVPGPREGPGPGAGGEPEA
jgi:hypothetical protein